MVNEAELLEAVKKQNLLYGDPAWNKGWDAAIEVAHYVAKSQRAEIRRLVAQIERLKAEGVANGAEIVRLKVAYDNEITQLTRLRTELKRIYDGPRDEIEAEFIKLARVVCDPPFREGR